jgi:hypothetical protein
MTPELRNAILRAQREMREELGQQTAQDEAIKQQADQISAMKQLAGWQIRVASGLELALTVTWEESEAVAKFVVDEFSFAIRKDDQEYVLFLEQGNRELARVPDKTPGSQFMSALGDFFSISGPEDPLM